VLKNPFYGGTVFFGRKKRKRDRRTGKAISVVSTPITAPGKHSPLWDMSTYKRILQEFKRRNQSFPGMTTRTLSQLLECGICGKRLWIHRKSDGTRYWYCQNHIYITEEQAQEVVISAIVEAVKNIDSLVLPGPEDKRPVLEAALKDL
jgi:hypothetical protein